MVTVKARPCTRSPAGPRVDRSAGGLYAPPVAINVREHKRAHSRAMLAGCGAMALWGALATLSVVAGPVPPFQMVAMTFTLGAAIGIVRARLRGLPLRQMLGWPARVWLLGIGGLFGYH